MTESKESMQNTIKNLQARTENIEKLLEKGNKTIVVQLGSHSIKFGLANDKAPFKVRTIIAYKLKGPINREIPEIVSNQKELDEASIELEQKLKVSGHIRTEVKQPKAGKPKAKVDVKMKIPEKPFKEIDPLFDDHAMWVADDPSYIIRRPIKYGLLNIESYTVQQTLHDLQNIFCYCINQKLKLKRKDHGNYNIVLVVPDLFPRPHLKGLVNVFMLNLQFKNIYLHLESVLVCFGTSVPSACVVDIGFEKISICCVDEGVILPGTVIRKNYGSRHINEMLLHTLTSRKLFGYSKKSVLLNGENVADMSQIDKLKEKACYIKDPEDYSYRIYEIYPIREGKQQPIPIPHNQLLSLPPNCLFSDVFNHLPKPLITKCYDYNSNIFQLYSDIEDHFQQLSGGGDIYPASTQNPLYNVQMLQPFIYNSLHDMICYSISNIKDADFRKRMANSIVLVGGAAHIPGIVEELQDRLIERINHYDNTIERVEIIDLAARDIAPIHASWLGGAVIPKLDSVRDLWIERNRYVGECPGEENEEEEEAFFDKKFFTRKERSQEWGIRYLKEKIPFQW